MSVICWSFAVDNVNIGNVCGIELFDKTTSRFYSNIIGFSTTCRTIHQAVIGINCLRIVQFAWIHGIDDRLVECVTGGAGIYYIQHYYIRHVKENRLGRRFHASDTHSSHTQCDWLSWRVHVLAKRKRHAVLVWHTGTHSHSNTHIDIQTLWSYGV